MLPYIQGNTKNSSPFSPENHMEPKNENDAQFQVAKFCAKIIIQIIHQWQSVLITKLIDFKIIIWQVQ